MFRRKNCCVLTPRAHLNLFPRANRHVHATALLHSHAVSTLGSLSVRKETCSGEKAAAFARREHTWISLRAQRDTHVPAKWLLRSHTASTLGSLSVRRETCSIDKTAAISRWPPKIDVFLLVDARSSFYSQARTGPSRYREPVTPNPGHRALALQIVDPISVYAVGELCR